MSHPTFARHETFHPRYGWLRKGVEFVARHSAWAGEDVHMQLGVGKNMATAIRYWCQAFDLIHSDAEEGGYRLTQTAEEILAGEDAADPYLESTASLWWLHYKLARSGQATTWSYALGTFGRNTFSADDLYQALRSWVSVTYPDHRVADSSVRKDVQLFLRMYAQDAEGSIAEDSIDSPFTELGLLHQRGDTYAFAPGAKPSLPDLIIAAACVDYAGDAAASVSLQELLTAPQAPGRIFRLSEGSLYDSLERVSLKSAGLHLSDSAGIRQLSWNGKAATLSRRLREKCFKNAL